MNITYFWKWSFETSFWNKIYSTCLERKEWLEVFKTNVKVIWPTTSGHLSFLANLETWLTLSPLPQIRNNDHVPQFTIIIFFNFFRKLDFRYFVFNQKKEMYFFSIYKGFLFDFSFLSCLKINKLPHLIKNYPIRVNFFTTRNILKRNLLHKHLNSKSKCRTPQTTLQTEKTGVISKK